MTHVTSKINTRHHAFYLQVSLLQYGRVISVFDFQVFNRNYKDDEGNVPSVILHLST